MYLKVKSQTACATSDTSVVKSIAPKLVGKQSTKLNFFGVELNPKVIEDMVKSEGRILIINP